MIGTWDDDGALDLLKRHSGIVWGPGRFAVLLRSRSVRRFGNPSSPSYFIVVRPGESFLSLTLRQWLGATHFFDGTLHLLKRHSSIVWGLGRFAGLLRGGSVRGLADRSPPPISCGASKRVLTLRQCLGLPS